MACLFAFAFAPVLAGETTPGESVLFDEPFEETNWAVRGWYDNPSILRSATEHVSGSFHSCEWHWRPGDVTPVGGRGGRVRLPPVTNVILSFWIKHSTNWAWPNRGYHPHEFGFLTDADTDFVGPAYTHGTFYVEAIAGRPVMALQDGCNIDESRIGVDLAWVTENRAVGGCNGDSDGYGKGDCYRSGSVHRNGKRWSPPDVWFSDSPGPRYKADWHYVRARFSLNGIVDGIGVKNGVLQYWYDGRIVLDHRDVVFRTGRHPAMKFRQLCVLPYIGDGALADQRIWIDDLRVSTSSAR